MTVSVGDRVVVWPSAGRGLKYLATVERVGGERATVRPIGPALSKPAWANSRRARSVNLTSLEIATERNSPAVPLTTQEKPSEGISNIKDKTDG